MGVQETRGKQEQHRAPVTAALHHPTWANSLAGKTNLLQEEHCRNSGRKDRGENNVAQACRRNWQGSLGAGGDSRDSSDTATSQHGARGWWARCCEQPLLRSPGAPTGWSKGCRIKASSLADPFQLQKGSIYLFMGFKSFQETSLQRTLPADGGRSG